VSPTLCCRRSGKRFSGRDKEEVRLRQEVGRNAWREATLVTSVGFTFSGLPSTPSHGKRSPAARPRYRERNLFNQKSIRGSYGRQSFQVNEVVARV